jgi:hypothetical protein
MSSSDLMEMQELMAAVKCRTESNVAKLECTLKKESDKLASLEAGVKKHCMLSENQIAEQTEMNREHAFTLAEMETNMVHLRTQEKEVCEMVVDMLKQSLVQVKSQK